MLNSNATIFYADLTSGAYLGGKSASEEPPPNSFVVPTAADYAFQVWDGVEWLPRPPIPRPNDFIALIVNDMIQNAGPWEVISLFYAIQLQGTANNLEIMYMRQAMWARIKEQQPAWLTNEYAAKVEAWATACGMPLV